MINNPDGSRRAPTAQEILDGIRTRSRNSLTTNGNDRQAIRGSIERVDAENRSNVDGASNVASGDGRSVQTESGASGSVEYTNGGTAATDRSTRGSDGRSNQHSGGFTASTSSVEQQPVYASPLIDKSLFAPYKKAFRDAFSKKTKDAKPKVAARVLSEQEAKNDREALIRVLLIQSEHMDNAIVATTRGHLTVVIWSDLDKQQAGVLADLLIKKARTNKEVAMIVRRLIDIDLEIQAAVILAPRIYRTIAVYAERGFHIALYGA